MSEYFVPQRFRKAVVLHVVKNLAAEHIGQVPLLLGIQGPSGEGKTFQCEMALRELEAEVFALSGGQLESKEAGEPAELLRLTYIKASRFMQQHRGRCAVVLINDIDTGLGDWGDLVQYTVNRQTVFGELMHFVDYPTKVEGKDTLRVPFILTGNNFTTLYEPLVRAGRMSCFVWEPTAEERLKIAERIFSDHSAAEVAQLVRSLVERTQLFNLAPVTIAFLADLRASRVDDALWASVEEFGVQEVVYRIRDGHKLDFSAKMTVTELIEAGCELLQAGRIVNYLRSGDGQSDDDKFSEILHAPRSSKDTDKGRA